MSWLAALRSIISPRPIKKRRKEPLTLLLSAFCELKPLLGTKLEAVHVDSSGIDKMYYESAIVRYTLCEAEPLRGQFMVE